MTNLMNLMTIVFGYKSIGTIVRQLRVVFSSPLVMMDSPNLPKPTPAWAQSFPEPRSRLLGMSPDALHELLTTKSAAIDFIVVDVRRTDIEVLPFLGLVGYTERLICLVTMYPGYDHRCHQPASADVLPIASHADFHPREVSNRHFSLFFVTWTSPTMCRMASRYAPAGLRVQSFRPRRRNESMARTLRRRGFTSYNRNAS